MFYWRKYDVEGEFKVLFLLYVHWRALRRLDKVRDIHGHLIDLGRIILLDVAQDADVVTLDEVDRHALAAETARPTDAVDVQLTAVGEVVADDQRHLLHVETATPEVSRDENTRLPCAELLHDRLALLLRHVSVHGAHREVGFAHLLREPVNLLLRVDKDDGLGDRQRIVQIAKGVELPLLLFHSDEELLDPLKRQFIALHQDSERIRHELVRHLQDLVRQSRGDKHDLGPRRKVPVDVVDLILEAAVEELVRLIKHEHLDLFRGKVAVLDHVEDTTGSTGADMDARLESGDVRTNARTADATMHLDAGEVAEGQAHLLTLLGQLA